MSLNKRQTLASNRRLSPKGLSRFSSTRYVKRDHCHIINKRLISAKGTDCLPYRLKQVGSCSVSILMYQFSQTFRPKLFIADIQYFGYSICIKQQCVAFREGYRFQSGMKSLG